MTDLLAPVSAGELLDKIAILRIKSERIADGAKLANVRKELTALEAVAAAIPRDPALSAVEADLKAVNESLWDIEDDIRACDARGDFGPAFVALAQAVYRTNDRRAALKREVNRLTGSALVEEKSYHSHSAG
jgi:predicted  nucleic acid-binding Zn-ribbon protein